MNTDKSNSLIIVSEISNGVHEKEKLIKKTESSEALNDNGTYEQAVAACGFGKFQIVFLLVCGWAVCSDSVEIIAISFVLPSACDLHLTSPQKGWLNGIVFVGMIIGGYLFGSIADVKGRRFMLIISMLINGVFGLLSSFSQSFAVFLLLRIFSGVGVGAAVPIIYTYFVEFLTKEKRGPLLGLVSTFWMLGGILTSLIAWLIIPRTYIGSYLGKLWYGSWRLFVAVCSFPALTSALLVFLMPESPKYLLEIGRKKDAVKVFELMFRRNKGSSKELPTEFQKLEELDYGLKNADECNKTWVSTFIQVVKSSMMIFQRPLTKISLLMCFLWFSAVFGFAGFVMWQPELLRLMESGDSSCGHISFNTTADVFNATCDEKMKQNYNIYYETVIVKLWKIPGNLVFILLINKTGRKILLAFSMFSCGLAVTLFALVRTRIQIVVTMGFYTGITAIGWAVIELLVVELYPTNLRSTALSIYTGIGRIASIFGNVLFGELVDFYCFIPLFVIGGLQFAGALSTYKLPKSGENPLS